METVAETSQPKAATTPKRRGRPPKMGGETPVRSYRMEPEMLVRINRFRQDVWRENPADDVLSETAAVMALLDLALKSRRL